LHSDSSGNTLKDYQDFPTNTGSAFMTSLKDLRLYTTIPHDCSYLPGKKAKTLFIDPAFHGDKEFHTSAIDA
jgi:hypothetical protein